MKNKGITLVALVVTIIILLILAGITISQLKDNGLFENAKTAKEEYENAQEIEDNFLFDYENQINLLSKRENEEVKTQLFSSENGSSGTDIYLSESYKHFNKLQIFYKTNSNIDYETSYQSVVVNVNDLENQRNFIIISGVGFDSVNTFFNATGYYFSTDETILKFHSCLRRSMTTGGMYYGDQNYVTKIIGIN